MVISQFEKVNSNIFLIIMVKTGMLMFVSSLLSFFFLVFFLWFGDPDLPLSPKAGSQIIVSEASAQALVWKVLILSFHNQRM